MKPPTSSVPNYRVDIDGTSYEVEVIAEEGSSMSLRVNGKLFVANFSLPAPAISAPSLRADSVGAPPAQAIAPGKLAVPTSSSPEHGAVVAPMPGIVVAIPVAEGQRVNAGSVVAVIEAMKMENNITAPCQGTIGSVRVRAGDQIDGGQVLVTIDAV